MKKLFIFIIFISLYSCSDVKSYSESLNKINVFLSENDGVTQLVKDVKYMIIIPEQGCSGCVSVAEAFYRDYSLRDDIMFVFCNVMSYKMLHSKLNINNENTIVDSSNIYLSMLPRGNRIYPNVIIMKEGKATALVSQSTKEFGLRSLRHHLENTNP